jgi:FkbM family methyltransferase
MRFQRSKETLAHRTWPADAIFSGLTVTIPPLYRGGSELLPGWHMVVRDFWGRCAFGDLEKAGDFYCQFFQDGKEYAEHRHVVLPLAAALEGQCMRSGHPELVIDIGANVGFYSLAAASAGCRVVAVEPQPALARFFRASVIANGWESRITVKNAAAGEVPGKLNLTRLWVPGVVQKGNASIVASVVPLKALLTSDVLLLKLDVDGPDGLLLRALVPLLKNLNVWNLILELNADLWPEFGLSQRDGTALLERIADLGYDFYLTFEEQFQYYPREILEKLTPSERACILGVDVLCATKAIGRCFVNEQLVNKELLLHKGQAFFVERKPLRSLKILNITSLTRSLTVSHPTLATVAIVQSIQKTAAPIILFRLRMEMYAQTIISLQW